jgi:hypothetical protein
MTEIKPEIMAYMEFDEEDETAKLSVTIPCKNVSQYYALRCWYLTELAPILRSTGHYVTNLVDNAN